MRSGSSSLQKVTGINEDEIRASSHEAQTIGGGIDVVVKGELNATRGTSLPPANIYSCEGIRKLSEQEEVDPTIVCVDEIQDIKKDSRLAEFIRDLHTQECLPILLVCAGLSNSQIVLDEVAISRPNSRHV